MNLRTAVYPGTFDPITLGHIDVAKRSLKVCDKLIIAIASDSNKKTLFTTEERVALVNIIAQENFGEDIDKIEIVGFDGLLINFAKDNNADIIVRGLRAVSDFEFEFQLASMNSKLENDIQTIFIPASENRHFIASNLVKEVCRLGGDVSKFVSPEVEKALMERFLI